MVCHHFLHEVNLVGAFAGFRNDSSFLAMTVRWCGVRIAMHCQAIESLYSIHKSNLCFGSSLQGMVCNAKTDIFTADEHRVKFEHALPSLTTFRVHRESIARSRK